MYSYFFFRVFFWQQDVGTMLFHQCNKTIQTFSALLILLRYFFKRKKKKKLRYTMREAERQKITGSHKKLTSQFLTMKFLTEMSTYSLNCH